MFASRNTYLGKASYQILVTAGNGLVNSGNWQKLGLIPHHPLGNVGMGRWGDGLDSVGLKQTLSLLNSLSGRSFVYVN